MYFSIKNYKCHIHERNTASLSTAKQYGNNTSDTKLLFKMISSY